MVKFLVDNLEIEADEGTSLLKACLDNDIFIPNLCYLEGMDPSPASCRLCFVEIEGEDNPLASCRIVVKMGMVVKTDTTSVRQLQRAAFQLLLSAHHVDCRNCPANKRCALQGLAKFLGVGLKPKRLEPCLKEKVVDRDHPFLDYYPNRCVLCGRCLFVCQSLHDRPLLSFTRRGMNTVVSFYGENDPALSPCRECQACKEICPVAAITLKDDHDSSLQRTINGPDLK